MILPKLCIFQENQCKSMKIDWKLCIFHEKLWKINPVWSPAQKIPKISFSELLSHYNHLKHVYNDFLNKKNNKINFFFMIFFMIFQSIFIDLHWFSWKIHNFCKIIGFSHFFEIKIIISLVLDGVRQ